LFLFTRVKLQGRKADKIYDTGHKNVNTKRTGQVDWVALSEF